MSSFGSAQAPVPVQPHVQVSAASPAPLVIAAGLASTAAALAGVWAIQRFGDENVMGWYANYVIPAGAILVGLVASAGFAVAARLTGAKLTGPLLAAATLTLLGGYWVAQYVEFRLLFPEGAFFADGRPAGLLDWYDEVTRSFVWKDKSGESAPLGAVGYLLRAGEMIGFCLGGLIIPLSMRSLPYCASCRRYMKQPVVALVPASVPARKIKKKDAAGQAAYEAEGGEAFARGEQALARLVAAARAGDPGAFAAAVAEVGPAKGKPSRAANALPARLQVRVVHCPSCAGGELKVSLVTGQGKQQKVTPHSSEPLTRGVAPRLVGRA
jgi:hypothetical protein